MNFTHNFRRNSNSCVRYCRRACVIQHDNGWRYVVYWRRVLIRTRILYLMQMWPMDSIYSEYQKVNIENDFESWSCHVSEFIRTTQAKCGCSTVELNLYNVHCTMFTWSANGCSGDTPITFVRILLSFRSECRDFQNAFISGLVETH